MSEIEDIFLSRLLSALEWPGITDTFFLRMLIAPARKECFFFEIMKLDLAGVNGLFNGY